MNPTGVQWAGAIIFAVSIVHTFSAPYFVKLAHQRPAHP